MKDRTWHDRIQRVLRHIDAHPPQRPDLETLAAVACCSPYHFHRIFVAMVGEGVSSYTRRMALQFSAKQLMYCRTAVTEIAFNAGYDSLEAFSRAFKAHYGVSPSHYRRHGAPSSPLHARSMTEHTPFPNPQEVAAMNVQVKHFASRLAAALRLTGPYDQCGPAWGMLCAELGQRGLLGPEALAIGICHDDPDVTPADKLRMECCLTLPPDMTEQHPVLQELTRTTDLYVRAIGGGEYATALVQGPYTLLHPAYRSLYGQWLPRSGREPDHAPSFEVYYNNPLECAPEDLKTEIFVPLKPL